MRRSTLPNPRLRRRAVPDSRPEVPLPGVLPAVGGGGDVREEFLPPFHSFRTKKNARLLHRARSAPSASLPLPCQGECVQERDERDDAWDLPGSHSANRQRNATNCSSPSAGGKGGRWVVPGGSLAPSRPKSGEEMRFRTQRAVPDTQLQGAAQKAQRSAEPTGSGSRRGRGRGPGGSGHAPPPRPTGSPGARGRGGGRPRAGGGPREPAGAGGLQRGGLGG